MIWLIRMVQCLYCPKWAMSLNTHPISNFFYSNEFNPCSTDRQTYLLFIMAPITNKHPKKSAERAKHPIHITFPNKSWHTVRGPRQLNLYHLAHPSHPYWNPSRDSIPIGRSSRQQPIVQIWGGPISRSIHLLQRKWIHHSTTLYNSVMIWLPVVILIFIIIIIITITFSQYSYILVHQAGLTQARNNQWPGVAWRRLPPRRRFQNGPGSGYKTKLLIGRSRTPFLRKRPFERNRRI